MQYRRASTPGGTLFFTLIVHGRRLIFASDETVDILRTAFRRVRDSRPFEIDASVVLPDHLHCRKTLPSDDTDFATRWRLIKTWFTKNCPEALRATPDAARVAKHEQAVCNTATGSTWCVMNMTTHGKHVAAGIYPSCWGQTGMTFESVEQE